MKAILLVLFVATCAALSVPVSSCRKPGPRLPDSLRCKSCQTPFAKIPLQLRQLSTSATEEPGNGLANLIDGQFGTRWSGEGNPTTLTVKLDSMTVIGEVKIAFHTNGHATRTSSFEVAVSRDGANWMTVVSKRNSEPMITALQSYPFTKTCARYIRITGFGNTASAWNSYTELEVWGCVPDKVELHCNYETGDGSQWTNGFICKSVDTQFTVVTDTVREGRYAGRFMVRPGDKFMKRDSTLTSGERLEATLWNYARETESDDYYYGWSSLFPTDWTEPRRYGIIMQWHSHFDVPPPLAFDARANILRVNYNTGDCTNYWPPEHEDFDTILHNLNKGKWNDFIVHVKFKPDNTGIVEVWHRVEGNAVFNKIYARLNMATLQWTSNIKRIPETQYAIPYSRNGVNGWTSGLYIQHGLYRGDGGTNTNVLYHDNWSRGNSFNAVRNTFSK